MKTTAITIRMQQSKITEEGGTAIAITTTMRTTTMTQTNKNKNATINNYRKG